MARQVFTALIDDIDGKPADRTVEFAIDGVAYSIDLSDANTGKLRKLLDPYINAGTRVGRVGGTGRIRARHSVTPARSDREQNGAIRAWAAKNGYQVSERGRIPSAVTEAYETAHR
jgi:hypothetical protein